VGLQRDELIFLDPHIVQESVKHDEAQPDDWENCEMVDDDDMPSKAELERMAKNQKKNGKRSRL
jgi:hypothetical protein